MPNKSPTFSQLPLLPIAFGLSFLYWGYLFCTSQTEIKWDSFDYEHLGQMLYHQGWSEFFRTGPNREPLYPLLLSLTMRIGDGLQVPYLKILAVIQFALLFLTQILSLTILKKLNVKPLPSALVVFYIGISPVLVNCALSLYSEILIIALIPAAILVFSTIFNRFTKYNTPQTIVAGITLALTLVILTFVKGIFEVAGPLILISSILLVKRIAPKPEAFKRYMILILVALITFWAILFGYKATNKHFNNNFTLTNRGAWAFYGFAARRVEPMSRQRLLAGLAFIPGEGACRKFFTVEECYFWSFYTSDNFGVGKLKELMGQGLEGEALDKELMQLSVEKIKTAPLQYTILSTFEGLKIFFWESTKLGFVIYPGWLSALYDTTLFKDLLRLLWAGLSLAGAIYGIRSLSQKAKNKTVDEAYLTLFFMVSLIFFYTAIYSLFLLGTRYAVPVAPLFICLFALLASQTIKRPR